MLDGGCRRGDPGDDGGLRSGGDCRSNAASCRAWSNWRLDDRGTNRWRRRCGLGRRRNRSRRCSGWLDRRGDGAGNTTGRRGRRLPSRRRSGRLCCRGCWSLSWTVIPRLSRHKNCAKSKLGVNKSGPLGGIYAPKLG